MRSIVWFRRDLRIRDNPAWAAATQAGAPITALFVLDDRLLATAGPHRGPLLIAHLRALDEHLQQLGGRLHVARGQPEAVVARLAGDGSTVFANRDYSPFARQRDRVVTDATQVEWHDGSYVIAPGVVRTGSGGPYQVFTPFYRNWDKTDWPEWPAAADRFEVVDDPGETLPNYPPPLMAGGEAAAHRRLETFMERVDDYPALRDRPDLDATSRLSADLKFGTISPRRIVDEVGTDTPGREAFVRQIAWRDFHAQILDAFPETPDRALKPEYDRIEWRSDPDGFAAWQAGKTGYPIVDAGMRQLLVEGWMHNRVRMIVGSFLVKDLLVDWREGERHFRRLLVDGDPSQNVGNWQWVAGTGADAAPYFRIFNPVSQSKKFDPQGDYIRRYVPELAKVPTSAIHAPWEAPGLALVEAGVTLGETYPLPIVDHAVARQRTLEAYQKARG